MKILVTGFDLWGGIRVNPSWEMVKNLPTSVSGHTLIVKKIPVVYSKIKSSITGLIDEHNPDLIIMFGLAESAFGPRVESYGWNYGASGRDAEGVVKNSPLEMSSDARIGYATTYNYDEYVSKWVARSNYRETYGSVDAGDFLCNAVIYYAAQHLYQQGKNTPYLFSHVPSMTSRFTQSYLEGYAKLIITKSVQELNDTIDFERGVSDSREEESSSRVESPPRSGVPSGDPESSGRPDDRGGEDERPPAPVEEPPTGRQLITNASSDDYNWTGTSLRYRTNRVPEAGTYRFYVQMDSRGPQTITITNHNTERPTVTEKQLERGLNTIAIDYEISERDITRGNGSIQFSKSGYTRVVIKPTVKFGKK